MEHSTTMAKLAAALAKAQLEFPEIPKTKEGKVEGQGKGGNNYSFSYKYADLGDVVPKVVPVLEKNGLAYAQFPDVNERGDDGLTTMILHESGEWMSGFMRLYLAKTTSQGHGSAITYARRYALCSALGIVADEDDDGQVATQQQRQQRPSANNGAKRNAPANTSVISLSSHEDLMKRIEGLEIEGHADLAGSIRKRIADSNFPVPFPPGAAKQVEKWVKEAEAGAPF